MGDGEEVGIASAIETVDGGIAIAVARGCPLMVVGHGDGVGEKLPVVVDVVVLELVGEALEVED